MTVPLITAQNTEPLLPPDEFPASAPKCQRCRFVEWEGDMRLPDWQRMHCGRWRELVEAKQAGIVRQINRPQRACWWERYGQIGRCGPVARYFEARK